MKYQIPLYLLVAASGTIIGLLIQRPTEPPEAPLTRLSSQTESVAVSSDANNPLPKNIPQLTSINSQLEKLAALVKQGNKERKALAEDILSLKENLSALAVNNISKQADTPGNATRTFRTHSRNNIRTQGSWFNSQAMIEAGVDANEAARIQQVYEDIEMQKLYLRDQAIRDGSIGSDDYRKKRAELGNQLDSLRSEMGEDVYDAYLFAAGQPNRVIILSALNNSPARQAGIQTGDTILRYDNQRIFNWSDLRKATTTGDANTTVMVEVLRDGRPVSVYVQRGPLGVQLDNQSVAP